MPLQQINVGSQANDGTGDTARAAFTKVNQNLAQTVATGSDAALNSLTTITITTPTGAFQSLTVYADGNLSLSTPNGAVIASRKILIRGLGVFAFDTAGGDGSAGFSQVAPGVVALGNGSTNDATGTLQAVALTSLNGNLLLTSTNGTVYLFGAGNIAAGFDVNGCSMYRATHVYAGLTVDNTLSVGGGDQHGLAYGPVGNLGGQTGFTVHPYAVFDSNVYIGGTLATLGAPLPINASVNVAGNVAATGSVTASGTSGVGGFNAVVQSGDATLLLINGTQVMRGAYGNTQLYIGVPLSLNGGITSLSGGITSSTTITAAGGNFFVDNTGSVGSASPGKPVNEYTLAGLPSAAAWSGKYTKVSNPASGKGYGVRSNGTNWLYENDQSVAA